MSVDTRLLGIDTYAVPPVRPARWTVRRSAAVLILVCAGFWFGLGQLLLVRG